MSLTVAFHTSRKNPRFDWFFSSLRRQKGVKRVTQVIIVDFYDQQCDDWTPADVATRRGDTFKLATEYGFGHILTLSAPKPCIWQGPHRVTKENHWAMSSVRNTSFALCKNEFIALLDDRCVLTETWLPAIKRAMTQKHILFGAYQKRHGLIVNNGVIHGEGEITGVDNREALAKGRVAKVNGAWGYGCNLAMPLEWALQAGGYPEQADGLSFEDVLAAMVWFNNGFPMRYDPHCKVIQDRTPSALDKPFRRSDKGVSPQDKSHAALEFIGGKKRCDNEYDLRELHKIVQGGNRFPIPTVTNPVDWFDGQPIREL